jgi:hypothetical protein
VDVPDFFRYSFFTESEPAPWQKKLSFPDPRLYVQTDNLIPMMPISYSGVGAAMIHIFTCWQQFLSKSENNKSNPGWIEGGLNLTLFKGNPQLRSICIQESS